MEKPLKYDQIQHNEPIYYIQKYWNRELTEHERNLVALTYDWTRTTQEAEEIKIVEDISTPHMEKFNKWLRGEDK